MVIYLLQWTLAFTSGICAIFGTLVIIAVVSRVSGIGEFINGAQSMTGLALGWFFLTTAWCMARFGGWL